MVRRAGRRSKSLHLLHKERHESARIEDSLGHLIEVGLVGRAATLHDAEELIFHTLLSLDVDLGREVALRVDFLVHIQRSVLAVAKILLGVSLVNTLRESLGVIEAGPDLLSLFSVDNRCTCVLAERQFAFGGHLGVAQEAQSHVFVIVGSLRIAQDLGDLLVVCRPQKDVHIPESGVRKHSQSLRSHLKDRMPLELAKGHALARQLVVLSCVRSQLEHRSVFEFCHINEIFLVIISQCLQSEQWCRRSLPASGNAS